MFDRNKHTDEASAASAQGLERKGNEGSLRQESNDSTQGPELAGPRVSVTQNRQGYCSCCHVHYNNLEQHVYSSQHRHFATYCRNRMGTTSLMERFLQDVLQHHPYRYHDNRPTYDDMPFISRNKQGAGESLPVDILEKGRATSRAEVPSTDSGFTAESSCLISQRVQEEPKDASLPVAPVQRLERQREHKLGTSQQTPGISSSTTKPIPAKGTPIDSNSSHKVLFTSSNCLPHSSSVSYSLSNPDVLAKTTKYSEMPDSISNSRSEQTKQGTWNQDARLNQKLRTVLQSAQSVPFLHGSPFSSQGNSLISGQFFLKQDGLQSQDETQISDLRDSGSPVGARRSLALKTASQSAVKKGSKKRDSVDEIIDDVILKYCYGICPEELPCKDEETNSCVNNLPLLDHCSLHGSDMSFDCDAAGQPAAAAAPPKATVKDLEQLKEFQINLQDENYGAQLSSIFKNDSAQQAAESEKEMSVHNKEPVLPALPHVPPSFVGKTWSQIMFEDDMKVEALVRDFREGRFRCHFDTESMANCTKRKLRKKKQKDDGGSHGITANTQAMPAQDLPVILDVVSGGGSDISNFSAVSETRPVPEIRQPQKRTWRLASRCQVVKVSHGTQTSVVNYPVVKQKIIRKDQEPVEQSNYVWSENEKTPNMKTRLCALKLPESYTKIMSPLQPKTVVYVLSCPEMEPFRNKGVEIPKMRRNHNSTDTKDSVRYKYKQSTIKYYDPLTNRVLKMPPKSIAGEKAKKPLHVRQLFRSLSLNANRKKQAEVQYECTPPKSFSSPAFCSSSAPLALDPVAENDTKSSHKTDSSSVSTERSDGPVCSNSEKSYKHPVLSPLYSPRSRRKGGFRLSPFNRKEAISPLTSLGTDCLERDNPKIIWQRRKGNIREPGFSKKASGPAFIRRNLVRRGSRKQPPKSTTQQKKGRKRNSSCTPKSTALSIGRHQAQKTTVGKHLKQEKPDTKMAKVTRKLKRTFLNTAALKGVPEKRQRATTRASSKANKWEQNGDKGVFAL